MNSHDEHTVLTDDGGWCWFQDPRSVHFEGEESKTYVGWLTRGGDVRVGSYDHRSQSVTRTTLHAEYEQDDHDAPSLLVRLDGRLIVFYSRHGGAAIDYRISSRHEDIAEFGPERTITPSHGHTYPSPYYLSEEERIYLFYRTGEVLGEGALAYVYSDDGGGTWSDQQKLITPGRGWCVYFKADSNGEDRIDLGLTYASGGNHEPKRNVRHVRFADETLYTVRGRKLAGRRDGTLPIDIRDAPLVHDSDASGRDVWIWDCSSTGSRPELAFAEFQSAGTHYYRYARWTGEEWTDRRITTAGSYIVGDRDIQNYYSGGIYLDHADEGVCYLSTGAHDGSMIQRWQTEDGGRSWEVENLSDASVQNIRPVVPRSRHREIPVLWMRGTYVDYDGQYDTAIVSV